MSYNKYSNKKTIVDGIEFDSQKESKRYLELKLLQKLGKISELILQKKFLLQESFKHKGETIRAINYVADFSYIQNGREVVEDVKGMKTDVYNIKSKILKYKYKDIDFREI